ncbi:mortality factor 4-like protein 1 [Corticium candelabrum]|uniref:mortality factor 4-like protein 1 n=1 Tax=Corticium candelabrum TaxID=121492 RepID=UPI002E272626|nr:mortality factor 4-like protein 1 [Corticium candelabrum]
MLVSTLHVYIRLVVPAHARESPLPGLLMPPKVKFQDGEKVLCYHGPLIYEAKCMKTQSGKEKDVEKGTKFLIHYNGWKKSWDEWVSEDRVLKYTDTNLQKQKELKQQHRNEVKEKRGKRKLETKGPKREGEGLPRRKRGRFGVVIGALHSRIEMRVNIPEGLKQCLLLDWEFVTKQKQVVKLPSAMPVDRILAKYVERNNENEKKSIIQEATLGIRDYFNVLLGTRLLFESERPQFDELLAKHHDTSTQMSSIYGAEHLLRLFVQLGSSLSYTVVDEDSATMLLSHLHNFLQFMQENISELFKKEYTNVSTST